MHSMTSSNEFAGINFKFDDSKISLANCAFVPCRRTIIGISIFSTFLYASMIPLATLSHLTIPPKILTKIAFTEDLLILF